MGLPLASLFGDASISYVSIYYVTIHFSGLFGTYLIQQDGEESFSLISKTGLKKSYLSPAPDGASVGCRGRAADQTASLSNDDLQYLEQFSNALVHDIYRFVGVS